MLTVALVVALLVVSALVAVVGVRAMRRLRFDRERLARMEQMAMTDELTGLPNRRQWEEQLPRELSRADRHHQPLFVVMLDLDNFKAFNDAGGHQAGDRLLKAAAAAWRSGLRPYDLLARYGGEEFSLILFGCSRDEARKIVDRLRLATPDGVTCSAGLAEWDRAEPADQFLARADTALYAAKSAGRNRTIAAPLPADRLAPD